MLPPAGRLWELQEELLTSCAKPGTGPPHLSCSIKGVRKSKNQDVCGGVSIGVNQRRLFQLLLVQDSE